MATLTKVEIKGLAELNTKITKAVKESGVGLERGINMATTMVSGRAKHYAPVHTGQLRASIHPSPAKVDGNSVSGAVIAAAEHAIYVEFGTGVKAKGSYPYKTGVNLAYSSKDHWPYIDGEGKLRIAKSQPARPFLGRALHESERDIDQIVLRGVHQSIKGGK